MTEKERLMDYTLLMWGAPVRNFSKNAAKKIEEVVSDVVACNIQRNERLSCTPEKYILCELEEAIFLKGNKVCMRHPKYF